MWGDGGDERGNGWSACWGACWGDRRLLRLLGGDGKLGDGGWGDGGWGDGGDGGRDGWSNNWGRCGWGSDVRGGANPTLRGAWRTSDRAAVGVGRAAARGEKP